MTIEDLFATYYTLYRTESDIPNSADNEFTTFVALAWEAINRWANYDNTFWKELYSTLQISGDGDSVMSTATSYATPGDMRIAGGKLRVFDPATNQTKARIPIIEVQDVQFQTDLKTYCYFVGDPNNGFTLNVNPEPQSPLIGMSMDYVYYKMPTKFTTDDITTVSEMSQPMFIVHRALANRFRGSRNPYYQSAKNDAEDILGTMQMENNSGNWADPWKLADNSSGRFGI